MPEETPPYNRFLKFLKEGKSEENQDSVLKIQPWQKLTMNPSARVYPYSYTPKVSKYAFAERMPNNDLLGVAGLGFPRKGIDLSLVGIKPLNNIPEYKGSLIGQVSKKLGNFNIGASINFSKDKRKRDPRLNIKYNFENGGKLPVRKEGESDIDYYNRWTPEDYELLNQQILEAELNYGTLNKKFLDEKNRANTVTQKALEIARELGYNDQQWAEEEVPAAKGLSYKYDVEDGEGKFSPRTISIDNPQDWEAIGMDFVNDPTSFVNNLKQSHSDPRENYLYDWDKEEYILDEEGNKQPTYQRGMGCIGAVCGIYNTAGATQVSDFPTGFGNNIVKAGDPIFKQMSNKFLDENDYAGMKAMGFVQTDNPNEGSVMRIAKVPGSPYSSHSMIVNRINQEIGGEDGLINTFDWDARDNVIENPGSLSDGIQASHAPYRAYKDRASYWNYVGNTPQYEKEANTALEELNRLRGLKSSSLILDTSNMPKRITAKPTNFQIRTRTPDVPRTWKEKRQQKKIQAAAGAGYPYSYFFRRKKYGGAMAPNIPTWDYPSKGTPIYRDTTDAPPKTYTGGGSLKGTPIKPEVQDIAETTVYGSIDSRNKQRGLFQKLDQLKRATKSFYQDRGLRGLFLKQDPTSEIGALEQNVNAYKEHLEDERKRYAVADAALKNLQKYYPKTWGDRDVSDVLSGTGYQSIQSLYKNNHINKDMFMSFYNNFAKEFDPNMAKGRGPEAVYNAREAREEWGDDWDDFVGMVGLGTYGLMGLASMGAMGPGIVPFLETIAPYTSAGWSSLSQPLIGSTGQLGLYSGIAPSLQWITPSLALEGVGAYYLGDQLGDSNSAMRQSWRDLSEKGANFDTVTKATAETIIPFMGAGTTIAKTAQGIASPIIGGIQTIGKIPQIRTFGPGVKEVWNKPNQWKDLFKQKSIKKKKKPQTKNLKSNVKADPDRDITEGKWYQDPENPGLGAYNNPVINPFYRRFVGSKAGLKRYNLENLQRRYKAGENISDEAKIAVERSLADIGNPKMQSFLNQTRIKYGDKTANQIEELVMNPSNYWNFSTFKNSPLNRSLLREAPVSKYEYMLPDKFAFDAVKKTSDLKNMSLKDRINYYTTLPAEYKLALRGAESKIAPVITEKIIPWTSSLGKFQKFGKITSDYSPIDSNYEFQYQGSYPRYRNYNSQFQLNTGNYRAPINYFEPEE